MNTTTLHPPLILWNNEHIDVPDELHIEAMPGDNSSMQIVTKLDGDYEVHFDKKDEKQVKAAKTLFDAQTKNGMKAYRVKRMTKEEAKTQRPEPGKEVKEFDPAVDHYLFMPMEAQVGG